MAGRCIAFFARSRYFFLILNFWTNLSLLYQILFGLLDGILLCATAVPPFVCIAWLKVAPRRARHFVAIEIG